MTMNMKEHILTALREQFECWEEVLRGMSEQAVTRPLAPSDWSTKDVMAHLWSWQLRSIARLEAARLDREPEFPVWLAGVDPNADDVERLNAWLFAVNHDLPWSQIGQNWRNGFQRFLEAGAVIPEKDLLDGSRYPWLNGHPLAFVLVASYDHHQEHLDELLAWLEEHE